MGLISGLLLLPLAPVRGTAWIAELLAEEAQRELEAAESPERALAELEAAHAAGELSDDDFETLQAELIDAVIAARMGERLDGS